MRALVLFYALWVWYHGSDGNLDKLHDVFYCN